MAVPIYPVGLGLCTLTGQVATSGATLFVEVERKFGYTGTNWAIPRYFSVRSLRGLVTCPLPFSDASGRTGDFGAPLSETVGYKLTLRLDADTSVQTIGYVTLLAVDGADRNLFTLTDLGGWPNQTVVVNPGGGGTTYVPVTVSGNSGYWSPA